MLPPTRRGVDSTGERGDLDSPDVPAPAPGILLLIPSWDFLPGQSLELFEQLGLIAFHRHQKMGTSCVEELRMASRRMRGINRDDLAFQVPKGLQERINSGVLVALDPDVDLSDDSAGVMVPRRHDGYSTLLGPPINAVGDH